MFDNIRNTNCWENDSWKFINFFIQMDTDQNFLIKYFGTFLFNNIASEKKHILY